LCDDDGFVLSLFLGSFFLFSLSFTNYGIPFLCPNDLPVQISGHLIPILNFFFVLLHVLFFRYLIVLVHIISYSIFFVLVFRCFFSVNYSYSNSFRTENRVVGFMRAWTRGAGCLKRRYYLKQGIVG